MSSNEIIQDVRSILEKVEKFVNIITQLFITKTILINIIALFT